MDDELLAEQKSVLRKSMKAIRATAKAHHTSPESDLWVSGLAQQAKGWNAGTVVAGYVPIQSEFPTFDIMRKLAALGNQICLPLVTGKDRPLQFLSWDRTSDLIDGAFGAQTPDPKTSQVLKPDVLLVPLLAFDSAGYRLGYGGGFYDRSIALYKPHTTIGIAFSQQQVASVPVGAYDLALTHVATEKGLVAFEPQT